MGSISHLDVRLMLLLLQKRVVMGIRFDRLCRCLAERECFSFLPARNLSVLVAVVIFMLNISSFGVIAMSLKAKGHQPKEQGSCLYLCELCKAQEEIPADVLEYFDAIDPGEPGAPASFQCERCPGIMYPVWWFRAERATP